MLSCGKMFFGILGFLFIIIIFAAGGQDLTNPDQFLKPHFEKIEDATVHHTVSNYKRAKTKYSEFREEGGKN